MIRGTDVHAHLFPQSAVAAAERGEDWFGIPMSRNDKGRPVAEVRGRPFAFGSPQHLESPARRVERMDVAQIGRQLVSLLPPLYQYDRDGPAKADSIRAVNDEIATMITSHGTRFGGLAALPLPDVAASIAEINRTKDLDFSGIAVGTHVDGTNWDSPALFPVLQAAQEARCIVLVHPVFPRCGDALGRHYLGNLIGNPFETTVAVASLVLGGVLDRLPELTVVLAHGGGYAPFGIGRIDHGRAVRDEITEPAGVPSDYLRSMYVDTLTHSETALRYLVETMGAPNVVLGTDYPSDMGDDDPVSQLNSYDWLADAERELILAANMERLEGR